MKSNVHYVFSIMLMVSSTVSAMKQPHQLLAIDETTKDVAGLLLYYADPADEGRMKYIFGQYKIKTEDGKESVIHSALIEQPYTADTVKSFQAMVFATGRVSDLQCLVPPDIMKGDEPFAKLLTAQGSEYPVEYSFVSSSEKKIDKKYYLYLAEIDFTLEQIESKNVEPIVDQVLSSLGLTQDQFIKKPLKFFNSVSRLEVKNQIVECMGTSWGVFSKNLQFPMARGFAESFMEYRKRGSVAMFMSRFQISTEDPFAKLFQGQEPLGPGFFGEPSVPEGEQGGFFEAFFGKPITKPSIPKEPTAPVQTSSPTPKIATQGDITGGILARFFGGLKAEAPVDKSLETLASALDDLKDAIARM